MYGKRENIFTRANLIPYHISFLYAVFIIGIGFIFCYFADQIGPLMPYRFHKLYWIYLMGVGFMACGAFIIANKPSARTASYLLAVLIFIVSVMLDLRNFFNRPDDFKYLYSLDLCRDLGLAASAIIIANFPREDKGKRRRYYYKSSSDKAPTDPPTK